MARKNSTVWQDACSLAELTVKTMPKDRQVELLKAFEQAEKERQARTDYAE